jgi:hypothetical protein
VDGAAQGQLDADATERHRGRRGRDDLRPDLLAPFVTGETIVVDGGYAATT